MEPGLTDVNARYLLRGPSLTSGCTSLRAPGRCALSQHLPCWFWAPQRRPIPAPWTTAIRCATLIGSYAVARRIFNHILPNPEIWVQHFSIAPIFMRVRGQYEKAFTDYKRALELDPSNPLIPYNMGNAYLDRGQPARAAEGGFTLAVNLDSGVRTCLFQSWHCDDASATAWAPTRIPPDAGARSECRAGSPTTRTGSDAMRLCCASGRRFRGSGFLST